MLMPPCQAPGYVHCSLANAAADSLCLASTAHGKRCRKRRADGNFCRQHYLEYVSDGQKESFWQDLQSKCIDAAAVWEEEHVALACRASLDENVAEQRALCTSQKLLEKHVREHGCTLVETCRDGKCLFDAIISSAELPLSRAALRKQAVAYLRALPNSFSAWFDTNSPTFEQYLFHMEQDGSYRDDLVVTAISHLMLRQVLVCTDAPEGSCADSIVKFYPPLLQ